MAWLWRLVFEREEECAVHTVCLVKSWVRIGCTLEGVCKEGVGDRVWSGVAGIGGESCDSTGAACHG